MSDTPSYTFAVYEDRQRGTTVTAIQNRLTDAFELRVEDTLTGFLDIYPLNLNKAEHVKFNPSMPFAVTRRHTEGMDSYLIIRGLDAFVFNHILDLARKIKAMPGERPRGGGYIFPGSRVSNAPLKL